MSFHGWMRGESGQTGGTKKELTKSSKAEGGEWRQITSAGTTDPHVKVVGGRSLRQLSQTGANFVMGWLRLHFAYSAAREKHGLRER